MTDGWFDPDPSKVEKMAIVRQFNECLNAAERVLRPDESIIEFRLAAPVMNKADYIMRFKAVAAVLDASDSVVEHKRCFVVTKSSNSGEVSIDNVTACDSIPDVSYRVGRQPSE